VISGLGAGKGYANTSSSRIRLETVSIPIPRLPAPFRGLKIGQLTDLHSSPIVGADHFVRSAELVMEKEPDVVVLTGDYIGYKTQNSSDEIHEFHKVYVDRCVEALSRLKAPMGIYGVLGNHDFWSGPEATAVIVREFEQRLGVRWLRNRHVSLERGGRSIALLGVDDFWEDSCSVEKALAGVPRDRVKILLSHNPEINEILFPFHGIDLIISGHTHGGQVVLPVIGTPFYPGIHGQKYRQGLVVDGNRRTYISRGVGHLVLPVRFNCPPEVTVFTLT